MANLKNWLPEMNRDELRWFDGCPKSVMFEIARQFALRLRGEDSADQAFAEMRAEWDALHANGIVPQKPFSVEKARAKSEARLSEVSGEKCRHDSALCYVGKETDDAHWRCGTSQCGGTSR